MLLALELYFFSYMFILAMSTLGFLDWKIPMTMPGHERGQSKLGMPVVQGLDRLMGWIQGWRF